MALSKLPAAFELDGIKKGSFPHFFNTWDNQEYIGPYPDQHYYGAEFMLDANYKSFDIWHKQQEGRIFNFAQEILDYCVDDVNILRRACLKYRSLIMDLTRGDVQADASEISMEESDNEELCSDDEEDLEVGPTVEKNDTSSTETDPFTEVTGASLCMRIFRSKFYHKDGAASPPIAQIPYQGYARFRQCSVESTEWLEYLMHKEKKFIRHALNFPTGEYTIGNYKADGYCAATNTVYLYHGCVFHGCRECTRGLLHPMTKQPSLEVYRKTMQQTIDIKARGYKVRVIWGHKWTDMKKNPEIQAFVEGLDIQKRLDPRYVSIYNNIIYHITLFMFYTYYLLMFNN
jgi:hypothetical protein